MSTMGFAENEVSKVTGDQADPTCFVLASMVNPDGVWVVPRSTAKK